MKRVLSLVFILLVVFVAASAGFAYWVSSSVKASTTHGRSEEFIKIEKGSSPKQIIDQLAANGIISNPSATMIYLRTVGDASKLQAGEYQFRRR